MMIPRSTHAQRAAYNAKNGAGAWAQKIGKTPSLGGMQGTPTPRPMGQNATPIAPPPTSTPQAAPGAVTAVQIPQAAGTKATPHDLRAAYNQKYGAGSAKGVSGHLLRQNFNQMHGAGAARNGIPVAAQPATQAPAVSTPDPVTTNPSPPLVDPNKIAEGLFPSTRMFEPENYEGSPLYQFQLKEGQKQVARSLAKRGLTNSGHGIEQELDVPMRAAAQDTDRMTRIASENASRLERMQQNEALRQERAGNTQWDRSYSLAQLLAQQSPWDAAIGGLDASAGATQGMGQEQANWLRNYYQKVLGGGGSTAQPIPLPGGPDYSGVDGAAINGQYSSNNGWFDLLQKGLMGIFG